MKQTPTPAAPTATPDEDGGAAPIQAVLDALRNLRFGSVTLVVQDGVIVQVERIEKTRLARSRKD